MAKDSFGPLRGNILTPQGLLRDHVLEISSGRIARIVPAAQFHSKKPVTRLSKGMLVPGFIDLQVNGVGACDLAAGGPEAAHRLAMRLAREGCTSFLAALITSDRDTVKRGVEAVRDTIQAREKCGAKLLGVHLEGPFLNRLRRGIHPARHIVGPTSKNTDAILKASQDVLCLMTVAPEVPGGLALVKRLRKEKIVVSVGHSNATYDEALRAFDAGVQSVTHLFNACSPLHHRAPGLIGAALQHPAIVTQIIPDGVHVHPAIVDLTYQMKGKNKMAVVTDALSGGGTTFKFANTTITAGGADKKYRDQTGTLAGSSLTMAQAFRNLASYVKAPLEDLIQCLTLTPATLLGLQHSKGSLEKGKDADMVWLNDGGGVMATWVEGEQVYVRDHRIHR